METDNPKVATIFLLVLGGVFLLVGLVVFADQYYGLHVRDEVSRKLLQPESNALRQLRAQEAALLSRYQWVDSQKGLVRIPVERAAELTLAEWSKRPTGYVAPSSSQQIPEPQTAPGAAPHKAAAPAAAGPQKSTGAAESK